MVLLYLKWPQFFQLIICIAITKQNQLIKAIPVWTRNRKKKHSNSSTTWDLSLLFSSRIFSPYKRSAAGFNCLL